ncbi:MAG: hypothetical protein GF329_01510 [Candidatus Lokiarchaeota archaeon]|nr:hypothetical protein [Candidatus Lokiarchaeota archaeon]
MIIEPIPSMVRNNIEPNFSDRSSNNSIDRGFLKHNSELPYEWQVLMVRFTIDDDLIMMVFLLGRVGWGSRKSKVLSKEMR